MNADSAVRATIRADLPPNVFARRPMRCFLLIPLLAIIIAGSVALVVLPLPWYLLLLISIVVGNFYASMLFLVHETGHGATLRSVRLQNLFMYPGCAIFCFSPHLWRIWHNLSHHTHTNRPDEDPDSFGTIDNFLRSGRGKHAFSKLGPGSGYWWAALYFPISFTLQAQSVLWVKSRKLPGYERLNRRRAAIDGAAMAAFWALVAFKTGLRGTVFVVLIPMLIANFVIMSYVVTNHMLSSLTVGTDSLSTTMSVTTLRLLDRVHLHFSHHVEHHLFPAMASSKAPEVRRSLMRNFRNDYVSAPHGRALLWILQTPRHYGDFQTLVDPYRGRRADIREVQASVRVP
jgi:fatty acid desaturase